MSLNYYNPNNKASIWKYFLPLISVLFVALILYLYFKNSSTLEIICCFFLATISFLINTFVLDNFKLSKNKFIRFFQKFLIFNIGMLACMFILPDLIRDIFVGGAGKTAEILAETMASKGTVTTLVASAATAALKCSQFFPPEQRVV